MFPVGKNFTRDVWEGGSSFDIHSEIVNSTIKGPSQTELRKIKISWFSISRKKNGSGESPPSPIQNENGSATKNPTGRTSGWLQPLAS